MKIDPARVIGMFGIGWIVGCLFVLIMDFFSAPQKCPDDGVTDATACIQELMQGKR